MVRINSAHSNQLLLCISSDNMSQKYSVFITLCPDTALAFSVQEEDVCNIPLFNIFIKSFVD